MVAGYLYARQPVRDIRVTITLPLDAEEGADASVSDARVLLLKEGQSYVLETAAADSGYYHYRGDDLTVAAGDEFILEVQYGDQLVTARTAVPAPPVGVAISADEMVIDEASQPFPGGFGPGGTEAESLTVSWTGEEAGFYFVTVHNVEVDPVPIESPFLRPGSISHTPMQRNSFSIQSRSISAYGTHRVSVYRANPQYVEMFQFGTQDPNELGEPPSNIENGLGIFTAFSSATVLFQVTRLE